MFLYLITVLFQEIAKFGKSLSEYLSIKLKVRLLNATNVMLFKNLIQRAALQDLIGINAQISINRKLTYH